MVLQLNLGVHNLLVRLRDNSNQEIKQDNKDENLIQNPEEINGINHKDGGIVLEYSRSWIDVLKDVLAIEILIVEIDQ